MAAFVLRMFEVKEFKRQYKRMEGKERLFKKADQSKGRLFHLSNKNINQKQKKKEFVMESSKEKN